MEEAVIFIIFLSAAAPEVVHLILRKTSQCTYWWEFSCKWKSVKHHILSNEQRVAGWRHWIGSAFRITGHLWWESTDDRWIPLTKGQWCGALVFSLMSAWSNCWTNKRVSSELRFLGSHYTDAIMVAIASQITSLTIVYSTVFSGADQRKHQSSASLAFVRRIHRWPMNSLHKRPVTRKMFPFDDVIMCSGVIQRAKPETVSFTIFLSQDWFSNLFVVHYYPILSDSITLSLHDDNYFMIIWIEVPLKVQMCMTHIMF